MAIWAAIFATRLVTVVSDWWRWRDDGVITLSHALNWAQWGSVGTSPGDRSEGFSSPLHFLVAAMAYFIGDPGYEVMSLLLFGASAALAAVACVALLVFVSRRYALHAASAQLSILVLTSVVALLIVVSWTSFGWLASGMENPLFMAAAFGVVAFSAAPRSTPAVTTGLIVALICLGLARVEFVLFAAVTVMAAALVTYIRTEPRYAPRASLAVLLVPLAVWAVVHAWRWLYFGELYPTSALAQGKSISAQTLLWIVGLGVVWLVLTAAVVLPAKRTLRTVVWAVVAGGLTIAVPFTLAAGESPESDVVTVAVLLGATSAWLVTAGIARGERAPVDSVLLALALIPVTQLGAMGPARLDDYRVFSVVVTILALWVGVGLMRVIGRSAGIQAPGVRLPLRKSSASTAMVSTAAVLLMLVPLGATVIDQPRPLGWEIQSQFMLDGVESFTQLHLAAGVRPIAANPDLGKASYAKTSQLVDLGYLGEPVLARLKTERPDLISTYLTDVLRPDVVQTHGSWSCNYTNWLSSPAFENDYAIVKALPEGGPAQAHCPMAGRLSVFHLRVSGEHTLTNLLAVTGDPAGVVRRELETCTQGDGPFACTSVMRAVLRNWTPLTTRGVMPTVLAQLSASPSAELDQLLITRPPGWADAAFASFVALADGS